MTSFDGWDPELYNRFADERELPFWDLARLIERVERPDVVDLGCGDGRLTSELCDYLDAASVLGVDSSLSMIEAAGVHRSDRVGFELGDIAHWHEPAAFDLVFANASLQWVPHHREVLRGWADSLKGGGQLAVQIPANADHPSHTVAAEVAGELLESPPPDSVARNVLAPEQYAQILDELGFDEQHVRLQVYAHKMASSSDVVEWVKGTTLTRFKGPLGEAGFEEFVKIYRERLVQVLGDRAPYLYPFKRILMWARRT